MFLKTTTLKQQRHSSLKMIDIATIVVRKRAVIVTLGITSTSNKISIVEVVIALMISLTVAVEVAIGLTRESEIVMVAAGIASTINAITIEAAGIVLMIDAIAMVAVGIASTTSAIITVGAVTALTIGVIVTVEAVTIEAVAITSIMLMITETNENKLVLLNVCKRKFHIVHQLQTSWHCCHHFSGTKRVPLSPISIFDFHANGMQSVNYSHTFVFLYIFV